MASKYSLGLDYGSNSVRALIVDVNDGHELAAAVVAYPHGESGVIIDPRNANLARQHPADYLLGLERAVAEAIEQARSVGHFDPADIIGLGVDTTGSTPMPIDHNGNALTSHGAFAENPAAMAWLWKDHTGHAEAAEITRLAREHRPRFLERCGGVYSSEWFWSKILRCLRDDERVFDAAATWVEIADWIPAVLTGTAAPATLRRGICASDHKAMFHTDWGGFPDEQFLAMLDPRLVKVRRSLPERTYTVADAAGTLTSEWARRLGLREGIPVAIGAFDAHLGAVGSGVTPGTLVKIVGTSTCDIMTAPLGQHLPAIPGLCGVVPESVLPGFHGLEAGQSAVGDIFNWFVNVVGPKGLGHGELTAQAEQLKPGQSGLLALDWHNGNRTILVDQRLSGLMLGMSLHSTPAEIYRALIESTAYGARAIVDRFEEYGVKIDRVINCGGVSTKNRLLLQIYADVLGRPMYVSGSTQTCALGSAIAGAVVAGKAAGGHSSYADAIAAMTHLEPNECQPIAANVAVYDRLYALYHQLHDVFGLKDGTGDPYAVMKELLAIRDEVRSA